MGTVLKNSCRYCSLLSVLTVSHVQSDLIHLQQVQALCVAAQRNCARTPKPLRLCTASTILYDVSSRAVLALDQDQQ